MKPGCFKYLRPDLGIAALWLLLTLFCAEAFAAEGGDWRPTFDLIMRWVNFIILVAVIVKFGRRPLKDFLTGRQEEIAIQLKRLEEQKTAMLAKVAQSRKELEESAARLEELKERILQLGERRKQEIISEAQLESRMIIESAKHKMEGRLQRAQRALRAEMVDTAYAMALDRLPQLVTADDNRRLLEQFLSRAAAL